MDILSLSLKATAEAPRAFGPDKGLKGAFAESFAGAKGLAPPGPEPPPIAPLAKSGEEGATPEPIAPAQDPDFSPDLSKEIDPGDPNILIDFDLPAAPPKEPIKVGNRNPQDEASAAGLQTMACFGVIVVPFEELPQDLSFDGTPSQAPGKPEQGWTGSRGGTQFDGVAAPVPTKEQWAVHPIKKLPPGIALMGERHKPWKEGHSGIAIDFPTKPDPILEMPQPFTGERPKKPSEDFPIVTPKPWSDASAGPLVVANDLGAQRPSDDAPPVKDAAATADPDDLMSGPKPQVIHLGNDVVFKEPVLEIPGHPQNNVTDPFISGKPEKGDTKEIAGQKEPTKGVPTADEAKPADLGKGDPNKSGNESNANRPLRAIPKPEIERISEKDDVKVQPAESKPSAEAIAKPKPISLDKAPDKYDLTPKQADAVVRQVLDRIDALAASKGRKITIHLDPKEFGSITLVVGRRGGEVNAEIYASNDRVRQALEANRPNLAAGLDQRGIQLSSLTVGSELPHGSGRQEQAMHDMARQHHPNMSRFERSETTTLSLDAIRGLARKASGVDLWI